MFFFIENGNEKRKTIKRRSKKKNEKPEPIVFERRESWVGEKETSRSVLERFMKTENPDEIWYFKHRAFEAKFKKISSKWYLLILPDWFFSFDGFNKSSYHADDLKWLKKNSNTETVFNDFRFIHYFLKFSGNNLFKGKGFSNLLEYGNYLSFHNAPFLYDEAWNPPEEKKKNKKEENIDSEVEITQGSLF